MLEFAKNLVLVFSLAFLPAQVWANSVDNARPVFTVSQGVAQLQGWNPEEKLALKGAWRVFPGQFIEPSSIWQKFDQAEGQFVEPGRSLFEIDPKLYPDNHGAITYALELRNIPQLASLGLDAPSVFTAAQVFWVSRSGVVTSLFTIGQPGLSRSQSYPGANPQRFADIPKGDSNAVLVIHLSNYHHSWGGLWQPPTLASARLLEDSRLLESNANFLMIGGLLFIVFYSASLYARRPEDKGSLWLAILTMGFVVRMSVYIGGLRLILPDSLVFSWTLKLIYASMAWGPLFGYYFFNTYFPKQFKLLYAKIATWIAVPVMSFIFLTPPEWFGLLGNPLIYVGTISAVFMCYQITRVYFAREVGGAMSFYGMIALMTGTFLEIASALGIIPVILNAMGYGIVIFLAFQTQIVAVRFVQAFRQSEHLGRELQKEVDRQTRDLKSILDNIKQGIFTLVSPLQVAGPQFSPFTQDMLRRPQIEGCSLDDLLLNHCHISTDQKDQLHAAMNSCLGESVLNYEVNASCFPSELVMVGESNGPAKVLEVDWSPIVDNHGAIEKLLVCVRDVTEIRQLRLEAEQNQREIAILNEIVTVAEDRFVRFIAKAHEYVSDNEFFIKQNEQGTEQVAKRLFVNYHTLKGTARTYQLRQLSTLTHDVEHVLSEYLKGHIPWNQKQLMDDLDSLRQGLVLYEKVAREKLHWNLKQKTVKLKRDDIVNLLPHLRGLEQEVQSDAGKIHLATLGNRLMESVYTRLTDIINESMRGLDSIARDLDKKTPEVLQSPNQYLMVDDWADRLHGTLTHVFRNSIDHGLEKPAERLQQGKEERGRIFVRAIEEQGSLRLEIQDDGRGLNLDRIERLARDKGLLTASSASDLEIASMIFQAGFSTKDAVTEISGRGVGMDAVRSLIEERGGKVALELDANSITRQHVNFVLLLHMPPRSWVLSPLIEDTPEKFQAAVG